MLCQTSASALINVKSKRHHGDTEIAEGYELNALLGALRALAVRIPVTGPGIAAYLASPRRLPFNQQDIFRHYPELEEE
jgi:hypothetical protein